MNKNKTMNLKLNNESKKYSIYQLFDKIIKKNQVTAWSSACSSNKSQTSKILMLENNLSLRLENTTLCEHHSSVQPPYCRSSAKPLYEGTSHGGDFGNTHSEPQHLQEATSSLPVGISKLYQLQLASTMKATAKPESQLYCPAPLWRRPAVALLHPPRGFKRIATQSSLVLSVERCYWSMRKMLPETETAVLTH